MVEPSASQFRGAIDFSALKSQTQSEPKNAAQSSIPRPLPETGVDDGNPAVFRVPSLVIEIDQQVLPNLLGLSEEVPILVDVYSMRAPGSQELSAKLLAEVKKRDGSVLLARLDADNYQPMLKAFQVQQLPGVTALIKGQSVPLFSGDQSPEAITQVVDRMLSVARDNGVAGTVQADSDEPEMGLPPQHQEAFDLIDAGDYEGAALKYQRILDESPADSLAVAGLAQSKLLARTDGKDLTDELQRPVTDFVSAISVADAYAVTGQFEQAFRVLLDRFEISERLEQDQLKSHLLDLFKTVTSDDPALVRARIRLANLLF